MTLANLRIEPANEQDIPLIIELIRGLAVYERLLEYVDVTEERLRENLFGPNAKAKALIAYHEGQPCGYAIYYYTFSSFAGLCGLYLEDLFVLPDFRGLGIGRALLHELAKLAKRENCFKIEWAVLHWNEDAILFYRNLGAEMIDTWAVYRLANSALAALAAEN